MTPSREGDVVPIRALLAPLAPLYGLAVRARNAAYDSGRRAVHALGCPVVSIGNLTTGGTGKTPITQALARHALAAGHRPAILMRGYRARGSLAPVPAWRDRPPRGTLATFGDEALLHARALPEVAVYAHPDRVRAAREALGRGATLFLLDDGFQHRRVAREDDIVCLDWRRPLGRGGLLPSGDLREPVTALARATAIAWTRYTEGPGGAEEPGDETLARIVGTRSSGRWRFVVRRVRRAGALDDGDLDPGAGAPRRVVLVTGVGNPDSVRESVDSLGIHICAERRLGDHARIDADRVRALAVLAARHEADAVLTTEKDEVRFLAEPTTRALLDEDRLAVLELAVEPLDPVERLLTTPL